VERAENLGLDLVMVAPKATPPVCRIMDFGKFQYEQQKKERDAKKKQTQSKLKEVKFHPNIDEHDYQTKINRAIDFLKKGYKVKASMFFRGREMAHTEIGMKVMERVSQDLAEYGSSDRAQRNGRMIIVLLTPGSTK
jgi:translation initiation factor IF-3